jgi:hypothetical protein
VRRTPSAVKTTMPITISISSPITMREI